jgi:hypothetical protein
MKNSVWTPALKQFVQPGVNEEAVSWTFYHMRRQAAAAFAPSQQFFNVGKGGTDGAVSVTEMEKASAVTAPKRFLVTAINLIVAPENNAGGNVDLAANNTTVNSIAQVVDNTVLGIYISDKKYLEVPASMVPAGAGLSGFQGTSVVAGNYVTNGLPTNQNGYNVLLPIPFEFAFYALLTAPKAFTTTAAVRVTVALQGILVRPKQ